MSDASKEELEEYVEMNDHKGTQGAEQQLDEYVDVNGKDKDSNNFRKIVLCTLTWKLYRTEVPVYLKKPSLDSTNL